MLLYQTKIKKSDKDKDKNSAPSLAELVELKTQISFEKKIFEKTSKMSGRNDADVLIYDSYLCVYKNRGDIYLYIISEIEENELIMLSLLNGLEEAIGDLIRKENSTATLTKKSLLDNLDYVLLSIDEVVDDGLILETEPMEIVQRVSMAQAVKDIPLSEQSLTQAIVSAKDHLVRSFS